MASSANSCLVYPVKWATVQFPNTFNSFNVFTAGKQTELSKHFSVFMGMYRSDFW